MHTSEIILLFNEKIIVVNDGATATLTNHRGCLSASESGTSDTDDLTAIGSKGDDVALLPFTINSGHTDRQKTDRTVAAQSRGSILIDRHDTLGKTSAVGNPALDVAQSLRTGFKRV